MKSLVLLLIFCCATGQQYYAGNSDNQNPLLSNDNPTSSPTPIPKIVNIPDIPYVIDPDYNYAEALAMSMLFYEAQRSGKLPDDQRVKWRGDSATNDGIETGYDLTGGYYDGASYIKYGFTMAFTTTVLSWGVIRYRRAYEILDQLEYALKTIKWATDYFLKCHVSEYEFFGQVSDKPADSQYMGRPENMTYRRKSYMITKMNPGSDLAAETAAALAAASIVFQPTDPEYSKQLLDHAKQLYRFATEYPGVYSDAIQLANQAYGSSKYKDEIAWGAAWLYKRTGEMDYLADAERLYQNEKLNTLVTEFSWSTKQAGLQVLLLELTGKQRYRNPVEMFCDYAQPKSKKKYRSKSRYTPKGLLYINQWGSLRYAANSAFLCAMAADLKIDPEDNRLFATKQINYILGDSGRSFLVGFGENYPKKPYHKSSFCQPWPAECTNFIETLPNAHILYGALVGGPSSDDSFRDQRANEKQSSVTIDFNAGLQSALAALLDFYIFGDGKRTKPDPPGVITVQKASLPPRFLPSTPKPMAGHDWVELLRKSLLFYDAQRSGLIKGKDSIPWRKSSGLNDRFQKYDLSGGYYDGPGYVKYGLPLCFSMTMLSWSLIEYKDAYKVAGEYKNALSALRWGMDYILKTHIYEKIGPNSTWRYIVGQISDYNADQSFWDRPERMNTSRTPYLISPDHPGTELSGEMVAALAAASIVFEVEQDDLYSSLLFNHSVYIFRRYIVLGKKDFYTSEITQALYEYPSSGYNDEISWAAAWINEKRKHQYYYQWAMKYYTSARPTDFSWDNKTAGVQLLIGISNRNPNDIAAYCNWLVDYAPRTRKGLLYLHDRYPAKYAANAAFILLLTYEKFPHHYRAIEWRNFGYRQMEYLIGATGRSYVIGYGPNQPTQPYHKASSCPKPPQPCGFRYKSINASNPQKLIGALVGGPDSKDEFEDSRLNEAQSRVSLDGNAGFQAAVAAIYHLQINMLLGNTAAAIAFPSMAQILFCLLIAIFQCLLF